MAVAVPHALQGGVDGLKAGDAAAVRAAAWTIALLGLGVIFVRTVSRVGFFTPARRVEFDLREDLFARLLRQQPGFYTRYPTGDLLSRVTSDVTFARAVAGFGLLQAVNALTALGLALSQMLVLSPVLTLACAVPVGVGFAAVQAGSSRMLGLQRRLQAEVAVFSDQFLGTITGVATIQAFTVEESFTGRLDATAGRLRGMNLQLARLRALVFPLLSVSSGIAVFLLLAVGGTLAASDELTAGQIAAFLALLAFLLMPMRLMGVLLPVFQRAEASLERLWVVFEVPIDRPDLPRPEPFPAGSRGPTITVQGLTWGYAPDRPVLHGLDFELPGGGTLGVFGRTGSGKSTLLRLLSRLENPPPGTVRLDGVDLRDIHLDELRQHLVYVPQSPFLFSETIRENVAMGLDEARVGPAVAAAALTTDLRALPEGLDTVVGERGIVLSGGQRQRVTLARALAREGAILLLDDVLSAVDHLTEQELLRTLEARVRRSTTVLVSHRMSALETCDRILVLDEGRMVDLGPHEELVMRPGPYRDAWEAQRGGA